MDKKTVMIVDDNPHNIRLLSQILKDQYTIRVATNGEEALQRIQISPSPSLVLLDVMMPDMDGYTVLKKLKSSPETAKIPVIFVTAKDRIEDEAKGFELGAVDYIIKPISSSIVKSRVSTHISLSQQNKACEKLVLKRTAELRYAQHSAIYMLGEAGHYNDTDTGNHIWRMAAYCGAIAKAVDWPVEKVKMLELAAPMHDTGKIGIPDKILKAPRKLTKEEWDIMKKHTTIGHSILSKSDAKLFEMAACISKNHHEKWDGNGYPNGLSQKEIPDPARIVAIADVFDALTTKRPYKDAWPTDKAFTEIENGKGNHFDPILVDKFLEIKDIILKMKEEWDQKTDVINHLI